MNTLETLQALRQEIFFDCTTLEDDIDDMPELRDVLNAENNGVNICLEVIDEYNEREKQNQNQS